MPAVTAQPTPNPNSLKFTVAGVQLIASGLRTFSSPTEAEGDPLGAPLLAIRGVANVFVVSDFLTVTKHPAASWDEIVPAVEQVLSDYASAGGE